MDMSFMNEDFNTKYMSGVPKTPGQKTYTYGGQAFNAAGLIQRQQEDYLNKLNVLAAEKLIKEQDIAKKEYAKQKSKTMSEVAQSLVSSGLSNTPMLVQAEKGFESEIGEPFRASLQAQWDVLHNQITEQKLQSELNKNLQWVQEQENKTLITKVEYPNESSGQTSIPESKTGSEIAKSITGGYVSSGDVLPSSALNSSEELERDIFSQSVMPSQSTGTKISPTYKIPASSVATYAQWQSANPKGTNQQYLDYYKSMLNQ